MEKRILRRAAFISLLILFAFGQTTWGQVRRRGCLRVNTQTRAEDHNIFPVPYDFDASKTYRQPVVLISFSDLDFSMDNPAEYYNRLFNEPGFNEGVGRGCVADYFREQSRGRLNLQFDIYGPVKVEGTAKRNYYYNYGESEISDAVKKLREAETADFSIYDWNGNGRVNQVVFVAAGYTGNDVSGYIWPNSSPFASKMPGDIYADFSSISCEMWEENKLCGIGTIIHEFCHCLGLPDIYPLYEASAFSAVDEWDLMDGGNYTNLGWCPPNLSAMELMYMGWATPIELTEPTTIQGMKPLSQNGNTYIVRCSSNADEFYLLENRRQEGWDYGCPGNGLLIFHVDFDEAAWRDNSVNIDDKHFRYDLFHADGKDYLVWDPANDGADPNKYTMDNWLRSSYLSTSSYPFTDPLLHKVMDALTDNSMPAATVFTGADDGRKFMGKPITDIRLSDDGTVSFNFMGGGDGIINSLTPSPSPVGEGSWYDLSGRRIHQSSFLKGQANKFERINHHSSFKKGIYITNGKKILLL